MRRRLIIISTCIIIGILLFYKGTGKEIEGKKEQGVKISQTKDAKKKERVLDKLVLDSGDRLQLIYNGDVVISFKNERITLDSNITEEKLFNNGKMPNVEFRLHKITGSSYIGVTEYSPSMKTMDVTERIFKINNDQLISFWSSDEIVLKLLKVDKNHVEIGSSVSSKPIILKLTEKEGQAVVNKLEDIRINLKKDNLNTDKSFWKDIQDNLIGTITGCNWLDTDKDGDNEMILSLYCYTVGAKTPVYLRENGIMIFEVGESVELNKVIFERDNKDSRFKEYFIRKV